MKFIFVIIFFAGLVLGDGDRTWDWKAVRTCEEYYLGETVNGEFIPTPAPFCIKWVETYCKRDILSPDGYNCMFTSSSGRVPVSFITFVVSLCFLVRPTEYN